MCRLDRTRTAGENGVIRVMVRTTSLLGKDNAMLRHGLTLILGCLLSVGLGLGCSTQTGMQIIYPHADKPTLTQTSIEHRQSISRIAAHDRRALVEDLDVFFMTDRPTRLSRWR